MDRVYKLPQAKSFVEWLDSEGLVARPETELSDSSNFGMAKSMVMLGHDTGYDMTSEAGMAESTAACNRSRLATSRFVFGHRMGDEHPRGRKSDH